MSLTSPELFNYLVIVLGIPAVILIYKHLRKINTLLDSRLKEIEEKQAIQSEALTKSESKKEKVKLDHKRMQKLRSLRTSY